MSKFLDGLTERELVEMPMAMPDLHRNSDYERDAGDLTEGEFRLRVLRALERIADAVAVDAEVKGIMKAAFAPTGQESTPAGEADPVRAYDDYRESGWAPNGSSLWEIRQGDTWLAANASESVMFNQRLAERQRRG